MIHPDKDQIYEIARKEVNEELLTAEEVEIKNHFIVCEACRNYFFDSMQVLDFLSDGKFAPYLLQAAERAGISHKLLFQMKFLVDKLENLQVISEKMDGQIPVFTKAPVYAAARGAKSDIEEFTAGKSIIRYDYKRHCLTVSIDEELAEGAELTAVLTIGGEKFSKRLESDRHGMLETEFELDDAEEASWDLVIEFS